MPAPASVTKWALYGGTAAASRGSQPGNQSNQPCGDSTAQAPAATLGTPSATKPSRTQVGTFAPVNEVDRKRVVEGTSVYSRVERGGAPPMKKHTHRPLTT